MTINKIKRRQRSVNIDVTADLIMSIVIIRTGLRCCIKPEKKTFMQTDKSHFRFHVLLWVKFVGADFVMGRVCNGPSLLWAEMSLFHNILLSGVRFLC